MTRKELELIAAEIALLSNNFDRHALSVRLARKFAQAKPSFDYEKWYKACRVWEMTQLAAVRREG